MEIDNNDHFVQTPAFQIPMVEESVKKTIMTALYGSSFNRYTIDQVYQFFKEETVRRLQTTINVARVAGNSDAEVAETITAFVEDSSRDKQGAIANLTNRGLTQQQAQKFLYWWKSKFTLRRLYLLGLTKTEIKECSDRGWDPSSLHRQLTVNPYVVEKVPFEKAHQIAQRYFLKLPDEYRECGQIVRLIDRACDGDGKMDKGKGWTCYPMFMLGKTFPGLLQLQTVLKDVFYCRIRYNFLYLRHQAEAEEYLDFSLETNVPPDTDKCDR